LVEGNLFGAFAGDVFEVNRLDAQIALGGRVHIVAIGHAVQHIGLEHRVVALAFDRDAVIREHMAVIFEVMANFEFRRILEPGFERREHHVAIELLRRAGVVVRERYIRGLARRHRKR